MMKGYAGRVLEVNLTNSTFEFAPLDETIARDYIGGKGYATRILYDRNPTGVDPLSPDNMLIFATGPLNGSVAPQTNRFSVVTKSPLTGGIGNATCGGHFSYGMKKAGIDVLILTGACEKPTRLEIDGDRDEVKFVDASDLWGKGTYETQEILGKKKHHACIGPAGENRVLFAGIVSQERIAGRTGTGAVMGSKKLKAITVQGSRKKLEMEDPEAFKEYTKFVRELFKEHPVLGHKLKDFGTGNIVMTTNARNILPTNNFQSGRFKDAMKISGEWMHDHTLTGVKSSCIHCPVTCGRDVERKGKRVKGPEYETLALLGSNLGNGSLEAIQEWNYLADDYGMDSISMAVVLGFTMELNQRGMLDAGISFGSTEGVAELIADIAHRKGLGDSLADGVMRMSERYGGHEFAMHVKGLELSAYDPRGSYAQGVEYATTNRGGDHTQGASMYMESTGPLTINPHSLKLKVELPVMQQNLMATINSMVLCMFTTYGMVPRQIHELAPNGVAHKLAATVFENSGPVLRLLVTRYPKTSPMMWWEKWLTFITGMTISTGHLQEIGARIFNLERMFNLREGLSAADDTLPPRILHESTFKHLDSGHPLGKLLPRYYKLRGWDRNGVPKRATLERLQIAV